MDRLPLGFLLVRALQVQAPDRRGIGEGIIAPDDLSRPELHTWGCLTNSWKISTTDTTGTREDY